MKLLRVMALIVLVAASIPVLADGGPNHQVKQTPPVKMGTSGGSSADASRLYCCGGTLGSLVRYDGVLSILSNNHILARSGSATTGEDTIQPGLIDVNCNGATANIVGDFAGDKVPLGTKNVDTAISTARSGMVDSTGAIIDIGVPCASPATGTVGMGVTKSGRTTGQTTGSITSVNTSVSVQYQKGCNAGKRFVETYTNQLVISGSGSFSAGGDSGSLIVTNDSSHHPVGLLFAGNTTQTIANPIQAVISAYTAGGHTFTFVGNNCLASSAEATSGLGKIGPLPADIDFATTVKERYEAELFTRPGVIGVGVGVDETDASRAAIVIYTTAGIGAHVQPGSFPADMDGVTVRVIPTEPFEAQ
ncbi:MAG TPA: hypothetical protein VFV19_19620 [Candidatus Polarisedimenticolaceae bacterium]|nr:hypothetical protein [Candidatus Polarisedimenticolaceae bacterium]